MKLTLLCIFLLNIADICFTQALVDSGLREGNLFVRYAMERLGDNWWMAKMSVITVCLYVFYRYRDLVFSRVCTGIAYWAYVAVVLYQLVLIKGAAG